MKKFISILACVLMALLFFVTEIKSQTPQSDGFNGQRQWQWIKHYDGVAESTSSTYKVEQNSENEIYIAGVVSGETVVGTDTFTNYGSGDDIYLAKLNTDGVVQYATHLKSSGQMSTVALHVDENDNKYIFGNYDDTLLFSPNLNAVLYPENRFVTKLDTNGNVVWATGLVGKIKFYDMVADPYGNLYATGTFYGDVWFHYGFSQSRINMGNATRNFIVKYNWQGHFEWVEHFQYYSIAPQAIAIDNSNNIVAGWTTNGTVYFINNPDYVLPAGKHIVFSKFSSAGALIWLKNMTYTDYGVVNDIKIDHLNNIFATGQIGKNASMNGSTVIQNSTNYEMFVLGLTSAGYHAWSKVSTTSGSGNSSYGKVLKLLANNNIAVLGINKGDCLYDNNLISFEGESGSSDHFVLELNLVGNYLRYSDNSSISSYTNFMIDDDGFNYVFGHLNADFEILHPSSLLYGDIPAGINAEKQIIICKLDTAILEQDAGVMDIMWPCDNNCGFSTEEYPEIAVVNFGMDTISNLIISAKMSNSTQIVFDTISQAICPGDSLHYTFKNPIDLSDFAYESLNCKTHLPNDENSLNDSYVKYFMFNSAQPYITDYPYLQDFENENDWYFDEWNSAWKIDSVFPTSKYCGQKGMCKVSEKYTSKKLCRRSESSSKDSYVLSPCFDFSNLTNPQFEMRLLLDIIDLTDVYYSQYYDSEVYMEYSTDAGLTFNKLGSTGSGINWYDTSDTYSYNYEFDDWIENKYPHKIVGHDLSFLAGEKTVRFRIWYKVDAYYEYPELVSIDDISVYDKHDNDLMVLDMEGLPTAIHHLSDSNIISIQILNTGFLPVSNFQVGINVNNSNSIIELYTDTIPANDTAFYTFQSPVDLSEIGRNTIKSWVTLANDFHTNNDTLYEEVRNLPLINTFPFEDDFESGEMYWYSEGRFPSWSYKSEKEFSRFPDDPPEAYSGDVCWHSYAHNPRNENLREESNLYSPFFDFSALSDPMIEMKIYINLHPWARVWIESSVDGGLTWIKVGQEGDILNWYHSDWFKDYHSTMINGGPYYASSDAWYGFFDPDEDTYELPWHSVQHELSTLAGEENVQFRIRADGTFQDYDKSPVRGFAFDDFKIYDRPQTDVGVLNVNVGNDCFSENSDHLSVDIYNGGTDTVYSFSVSYKLDDNAWINETYNGVLSPDNEITYSFSEALEIKSVGDHQLIVAANAANDGFTGNDTILPLSFENYSFAFNVNNKYETSFETLDYSYNSWENTQRKNWTILNPGNNITWQYNESDNRSRTLNSCFRYKKLSAVQIIDDYVVSPCFQLDSGKTYKISYWIYPYTNIEKLSFVYGKIPEEFYMSGILAEYQNLSASSYTEYVFNFTPNESDVFYFGLHIFGMGNYNQYLYFDDFSVEEFCPTDVKISKITTTNPCSLGSGEFINVNIKNAGLNAITDTIPVVCRINDTLEIYGNFTDSLAAGETQSFLFPTMINFSDTGLYDLKAWTNLSSDEKNENDTFNRNIISYPIISSFPYLEDFEDDYYWAVGGKYPSWGCRDMAVYPIVHYNYNPESKWICTNIQGSSSEYEVSYIESPCFDISNLLYPRLEFDIAVWNTIFAVGFQYSTDLGQTWTQLGISYSGVNWLNSTDEFAVLPISENYGCTAGWQSVNGFNQEKHVEHDLSATGIFGASSIKFRFVYGSFFNGLDYNVFGFDNFMVYDRIPGCTNPAASNYNPLAVVDDGSCVFPCLSDASFNYSDLGYNHYLFNLVSPPPSEYTVIWNIDNQSYTGDSLFLTFPIAATVSVSCAVFSPYDNSCIDNSTQMINIINCSLNSQFEIFEVDSGEFIFELLYPEFEYPDNISWNFGDGSGIFGADSVYHKYDTMGTYLVFCERIYNSANYCSDYNDSLLTVNSVSHDFQLFNLTSSWNIFSTYLDPLYQGIPAVLNNWQNLEIMKDENGSVYWPQYSINLIGDFTIGEGYQIKLTDNSVYYIVGYAVQADQYPLTLESGWNILGYLRQLPAPIDQLLQAIIQNIEIVKDENGWVFWPAYQVNQIGNMIPGEGYQIKMNQTATLTYPAN